MATTTTISQVGEFPLISSMVGDLTMGQAVTLGPGDDGAVFQVDGSAVVSTGVLGPRIHGRDDRRVPEGRSQRRRWGHHGRPGCQHRRNSYRTDRWHGTCAS